MCFLLYTVEKTFLGSFFSHAEQATIQSRNTMFKKQVVSDGQIMGCQSAATFHGYVYELRQPDARPGVFQRHEVERLESVQVKIPFE